MGGDVAGPMRVALVVDADVVPRHVAFLSEAIDDEKALCLAALIRVQVPRSSGWGAGLRDTWSGSTGASRGLLRTRSDAERRASPQPRRGWGRIDPRLALLDLDVILDPRPRPGQPPSLDGVARLGR